MDQEIYDYYIKQFGAEPLPRSIHPYGIYLNGEERLKERHNMEYFDIVDEDGKPTGAVVSRETAHKDGIPHRTAHVWIVRKTDKGWKTKNSQKKAEESRKRQKNTADADEIFVILYD